ncbi:MAG: chitobiase/beta-hexosaminidase C-terminal domain-containing protein [Chryseolinea sp.]
MTPTFSPAAGTYSSTQAVTISTLTSGASIRYTTDGSNPTASSTLYSTPVNVSASMTLKAIGIKSGLANSAIGAAAYTIQVATPTFTPGPGTYNSTQSVTILTATSGASIRYTTDGSTPTIASTLYTAPITVSATTTLRAIGIKTGLANSAVASSAYVIEVITTINNSVVGTGQNQFEYSGVGWASGASTGAYLNDEHYSATTNNFYQVDFTGTKIQVYSQKYSSSGVAAYSIDGGPEINVDHYNATLLLNTLVYTSTPLTQGSHTLKVRVTGTKNASSSSYWIVADRAVITSGSSGGGGGGRMDMTATVYSDEKKEFAGNLIYPNPGTGKFSLKSDQKIQSIEVYGLVDGKTLTIKSDNAEGISELNISNFADGVYLLKLYDGERYFFRRIIKQN